MSKEELYFYVSLYPSFPSKLKLKLKQKHLFFGSGCGSVGRAVASDTRGPQFESSHQQKFIYKWNICLLSTVYWKDENKEKEAGNGPFLKKSVFNQLGLNS